MTNLFCSDQQSLALKELGFFEPSLKFIEDTDKLKIVDAARRVYPHTFADKYFFGNLYAILEENIDNYVKSKAVIIPLKSQVFKWFRDKYDLFGCMDLQVCNPSHWFVRIDIITENDFVFHSEDENLKFQTYEEAENYCLDKLIELQKVKL